MSIYLGVNNKCNQIGEWSNYVSSTHIKRHLPIIKSDESQWLSSSVPSSQMIENIYQPFVVYIVQFTFDQSIGSRWKKHKYSQTDIKTNWVDNSFSKCSIYQYYDGSSISDVEQNVYRLSSNSEEDTKYFTFNGSSQSYFIDYNQYMNDIGIFDWQKRVLYYRINAKIQKENDLPSDYSNSLSSVDFQHFDENNLQFGWIVSQIFWLYQVQYYKKDNDGVLFYRQYYSLLNLINKFFNGNTQINLSQFHVINKIHNYDTYDGGAVPFHVFIQKTTDIISCPHSYTDENGQTYTSLHTFSSPQYYIFQPRTQSYDSSRTITQEFKQYYYFLQQCKYTVNEVSNIATSVKWYSDYYYWQCTCPICGKQYYQYISPFMNHHDIRFKFDDFDVSNKQYESSQTDSSVSSISYIEVVSDYDDFEIVGTFNSYNYQLQLRIFINNKHLNNCMSFYSIYNTNYPAIAKHQKFKISKNNIEYYGGAYSITICSTYFLKTDVYFDLQNEQLNNIMLKNIPYLNSITIEVSQPHQNVGNIEDIIIENNGLCKNLAFSNLTIQNCDIILNGFVNQSEISFYDITVDNVNIEKNEFVTDSIISFDDAVVENDLIIKDNKECKFIQFRIFDFYTKDGNVYIENNDFVDDSKISFSYNSIGKHLTINNNRNCKIISFDKSAVYNCDLQHNFFSDDAEISFKNSEEYDICGELKINYNTNCHHVFFQNFQICDCYIWQNKFVGDSIISFKNSNQNYLNGVISIKHNCIDYLYTIKNMFKGQFVFEDNIVGQAYLYDNEFNGFVWRFVILKNQTFDFLDNIFDFIEIKKHNLRLCAFRNSSIRFIKLESIKTIQQLVFDNVTVVRSMIVQEIESSSDSSTSDSSILFDQQLIDNQYKLSNVNKSIIIKNSCFGITTLNLEDYACQILCKNNKFYKVQISSEYNIYDCCFDNNVIYNLQVQNVKQLKCLSNEIVVLNSYNNIISTIVCVNQKDQLLQSLNVFKQTPFNFQFDVQNTSIEILGLNTNKLNLDNNCFDDFVVSNTSITELKFIGDSNIEQTLEIIDNKYLNLLWFQNKTNLKALKIINCTFEEITIDSEIFAELKRLTIYGNKKVNYIINQRNEVEQQWNDSLKNALIDTELELNYFVMHDCYNSQLQLNISELMHFDVSRNNLEKIIFIGTYDNLQHFNISNNKIKQIVVKIDQNQHEEFKISEAKYLTLINISNNLLQFFYCCKSAVQYFFCNNMPNLQRLYLSQNRIVNLDLKQTPRLYYLDLTNQNKDIQKIVNGNTIKQNIKTLQSIVCNNTMLKTIKLDYNENIKNIQLNNNRLENIVLPIYVDKVSYIQNIELSCNQLQYIDLSSCRYLQKVILKNNPNLKFVLNYTNLQYLDCSQTNCNDLPLQICKKIIYLYASNNNIKRVKLFSKNLLYVNIANNNVHYLDINDAAQVHVNANGNYIYLINNKNGNKIENHYTKDYYIQNNVQSALFDCYKIQHLTVENCHQNISFNDKNIQLIDFNGLVGDIILNNNTIEKIKLNNCQCDIVDLSNNQLTNIEINNCIIHKLILSNNSLIDLKCRNLTQLQYLQLVDCFSSQICLKDIFENIKQGGLLNFHLDKILPNVVIDEQLKNKLAENNWIIVY